MKELEQGSVFGGCSYGIPCMDGLPCHHMVAVVKSSQIKGLNPTNAMPYWWKTECWRSQYPLDTYVTCDFDIKALRGAPDDRAMRDCPPYSTARKTGCPKIDKRIKGPLEGNKRESALAGGVAKVATEKGG